MTKLAAAYETIAVALAVLAGAIFVAMAIFIPIDVTLRNCCAKAIFGLTDLTEYGLAAATFFAAPWVLSKNAHVSVDIALMALAARARRRLDAAVSLIGAAVCAAFFWYSAAALAIAFNRGSMVRGILVIPEWLTFVSPTLSLALLTVGFLLRIGAEQRINNAPGL